MAVDMVVMVTAVDTMARGRQKLELRLRLSQDTSPEDTDMEDMAMEVMEAMGMDVVTMARGRLKPSQDILEVMVVMAIAVDMEDMAMDMDTMAKGRLTLKLGILEHMVDTAEDMDMVVMVMVDMAITVKL